ncbi:hypothetical protein [Actinokineospora fastidiosa]|uniref:Uncharacterized protein n=1 Tax=Actinokineospora fastidiosa TaxID=1816 RepID=A0A918G851_9PSEU|nr:hypothetical protein [Actinokineospora fastidiosa]GGS22916.1 hypothetical protein GCM10010171_14740 [Actinokineospora fastidiosa]
MADDQQPPHDRPGPPPAVPDGQPPAVPDTGFDAEQWQRFQRFQEFQRLEEAQREGRLPPLPPPYRRPLWRRILFSKLVRKIAFLLALLVAASWALNHYFGDPDENLPAHITGGHQETRSVIHASSAAEAFRLFYKEVGGGTDPTTRTHACHRFETPELEQRFADHFNAPSCEVAVQRLSDEVTDTTSYARHRPWLEKLRPGPDGNVVISSCELEIEGGPPLGRFTFRIIPRSKGDQWIITDHQKEAADCR